MTPLSRLLALTRNVLYRRLHDMQYFVEGAEAAEARP